MCFIEQAYAEAESRNVELELEPQYTKEAVWISWIERGNAPAGAGARVLEFMKEAADEDGLSINLSVKSHQPSLLQYYLDLGFEQDPTSDRILLNSVLDSFH